MEDQSNIIEIAGHEIDAEREAQKAAVKSAVEAIVYVAEEPVTVKQIVAALAGAMGIPIARPESSRKRKVQPIEKASDSASFEAEAGEEPRPEELSLKQDVLEALARLQEESNRADRGLEIREIAGGYKMFTKAEHHETIRLFAKNLTPPLRLSMAALETLATIAYRQPVTVPEIQAIRGVNAAGVLKTLLDRKLIATAGRKEVMGRPILYKTTREFLVKFGLNSVDDLPTLEEFGEIARAALGGELVESEAEEFSHGSSAESSADATDDLQASDSEDSGHTLSLVEPPTDSHSSEEPGGTLHAPIVAGGIDNGD